MMTEREKPPEIETEFSSKEFIRVVDEMNLSPLIKSYTGDTKVLKNWFATLQSYVETNNLSLTGKIMTAILTFPLCRDEPEKVVNHPGL